MKKYDDQPIRVMDTAGMTDAEFSQARKEMGGLGGSDAGAICGVSTFDSPQSKWAKKTGKINDQTSNPVKKYMFKAGHLLEEAVAQLFLEQIKMNEPQLRVEMYNDTWMYQAGRKKPDGTLRWPFLYVDLDRRLRINGKYEGILECKTISSNNYKKIALVKAGVCPPDYECQVRTYMAAMNLEYAYIAFMWGSSADEFAYILIQRDYHKEEIIMKKMEYFYKCMVEDKEPDELVCCYPELVAEYESSKIHVIKDNDPPVKIDSIKYGDIIQEAFELDELIDNLDQQRKELMDRRQEIHNLFYPILGDEGSGIVDLPNGRIGKITQTAHYTAVKFDEEKFHEENPDLYKDYMVERFDVKSFKKDYPIEYLKYQIPKKIKNDEPKSFTLKYERTTDVPGVDKPVMIKRKAKSDVVA